MEECSMGEVLMEENSFGGKFHGGKFSWRKILLKERAFGEKSHGGKFSWRKGPWRIVPWRKVLMEENSHGGKFSCVCVCPLPPPRHLSLKMAIFRLLNSLQFQQDILGTLSIFYLPMLV